MRAARGAERRRPARAGCRIPRACAFSQRVAKLMSAIEAGIAVRRRHAEIDRQHDDAAFRQRLVERRVVEPVARRPGAAMHVDQRRERPCALRLVQPRQQRRVAVAADIRCRASRSRSAPGPPLPPYCLLLRRVAARMPCRRRASKHRDRRREREGDSTAFAGRLWVCPIREVTDASPNFRRARPSARRAGRLRGRAALGPVRIGGSDRSALVSERCRSARDQAAAQAKADAHCARTGRRAALVATQMSGSVQIATYAVPVTAAASSRYPRPASRTLPD